MADEYGVFGHGASTYPLPTSLDNPLLRDADPALFHAAAFYVAMIARYVGPRLIAQAAAVGAPITQAVAHTVTIEPAPHLRSEQLKFPLLAVYRRTEENLVRGQYDADRSTWEIAYVLPFLTASQANALHPILRSVSRVLVNRTSMGADPSYTPPGGVQGESVWERAGIGHANLIRGRYGSYAAIGEVADIYPAWVGTLEMTERDRPVDGAFEAFDSVNVHEDIVPLEGETLPDVVEMTIDVAAP